MKSFFCAILLLTLSFSTVNAEEVSKEISSLKSEIISLKAEQERLRKDINTIVYNNLKSVTRLSDIEFMNTSLSFKIDSLQREYDVLADKQKADKSELKTSIGQTNEKVRVTEDALSTRTIWGICGIITLLLALVTTVWASLKKFKSGSRSIEDVRKAHYSLEEAQKQIWKAQEKIQEEVIQLDNNLIEILSNQPITPRDFINDGATDHSLTLKVADEIIKIEMNLSRMDESIKGYKQLSRGV